MLSFHAHYLRGLGTKRLVFRCNRGVLPTLWLSTATSLPKKEVASPFAPVVVHGDARSPLSYAHLVAATAHTADGPLAHKGMESVGPKCGGADLLLTDPPYCILTRRGASGQLRDAKSGGSSGGSSRKRKLEDSDVVMKFESVRDFEEFTRQWFAMALPFLRQDALLVIWTNPLGRRVYNSVAQSHGYQLLGEYIWAKPSDNSPVPPPLNTAKNEMLYLVRESALVFSRAPLPPLGPSDISPPWFVAAPNAESDSAHPCRKPREVLEPLVRAWSNRGDWVLDPFAGSGSTLQCCASLERHSYGIELNETWAKRLIKEFK